MKDRQLSQLRGQAAQLLRKYRIPLLVFLLGVVLALVPGRTKKSPRSQMRRNRRTARKCRIRRRVSLPMADRMALTS